MTQSTGLVSSSSPMRATQNAVTVPSSTTSFQDLPDEVAIQIFNNLNARELLTGGLVCRQWNTLSKDEFLWKDLFISKFPCRNPEGIDDFQKAYRDQLFPRQNFANGVYALHTLRVHTTAPRSLACVESLALSNGKLFARSYVYALNSGTITVWDLKTHECLDTLATSVPAGTHLTFANGKRYCLSHDGVSTWDVETKEKEFFELPNIRDTSSLTAADKTLFTVPSIDGEPDNTILVWDLQKKECIRTLWDGLGPITHLSNAEGKLFYACNNDTIIIRDLKTLDCLCTIKLNGIRSLALASGKLFAVSSGKESFSEPITMWDPETGHCLHTYKNRCQIFSLAAAEGKLYLAIPSLDIQILDLKATHREVFEQFADQFDSGKRRKIARAMDRFSRMPRNERGRVYHAMYELLKPSNDYYGCGEHAFHDQYGLSSTPQQKAQAIRNYLNSESK